MFPLSSRPSLNVIFSVVMYGCERWAIKKKAECRRSDAFELLEKTLESPLDYKEIKPVHPKGNQPWIFIGRTDAETETPIFWPPDAKNWLFRKDPDPGKDWRQEKGATEDEMVGWHHWLNGHEFEQARRNGKGQQTWCAEVHGVAKSQTWLNNCKASPSPQWSKFCTHSLL